MCVFETLQNPNSNQHENRQQNYSDLNKIPDTNRRLSMYMFNTLSLFNKLSAKYTLHELNNIQFEQYKKLVFSKTVT